MNLCIIYQALDGSCVQEVGPLNEDQAFPMQLHWPEGQPNIVQKLEEFKNVFSLVDIASNVTNANLRVHDTDLDEVKSKVDDLSSDVHDKIDAVEGKVDAVGGKVDSVQKELQELKDMISTLMGIVTKD